MIWRFSTLHKSSTLLGFVQVFEITPVLFELHIEVGLGRGKSGLFEVFRVFFWSFSAIILFLKEEIRLRSGVLL